VPFFYGWWVVIATFGIILVAGAGPLYVFSTLVAPLEEEFGWSRAAIGGGPSIAAMMAGVTTAVAGYLVDRVGARRLLVAGVLLVGGSILALSQIQTLWQFYISVSVIGVGMNLASAFVCAVAIAHWFVKRRGRALGIMFGGAGASGIMVLLAAFLIGLFGWRTGLVILGISQLAICVPGSGPPDAAEGIARGSGTGQPEGLTIGEALRTRSFWPLALALVLAWVGSMAVIIHVIAYLDESGGFTEEGAAVIAMGIPLGSLVGRLGFGWLADYLSKRWLLAAAWFLQGLGILIFAAVQSPWQAVLFLVAFAPGYGGAVTVLPALLTEYFGLRAFGGIQGLLMAGAMLGGFIGPIFAGGVYDAVDSYRPAFLVLALTALTAAVLVQMIGRPRAWGVDVAEARAP